MRIFKLFSMTALLAMAVLFGVSTNSKGKITMINTAKAVQYSYDLIYVHCLDDNGEVIGTGAVCEQGSEGKCTPIPCN